MLVIGMGMENLANVLGFKRVKLPFAGCFRFMIFGHFLLLGIVKISYGSVQMMSTGLEAKRENAGTKKSPLQIQMLERFYSEVQYPKPENLAEYATSVGLAYSQVRIWFKERRRKERREMEAIGAHMESQLGARSNGFRCNSSRSSSFSQSPMYNTVGLQPEDDSYVDRGTSFIGEKHILLSQVLFPKDYILRKVFCNDGRALGSEFDPLLRSRAIPPVANEVGDTTGYRSYQNQRVVKKRKKQIMARKKVDKRNRPRPNKRKVNSAYLAKKKIWIKGANC